MGSVHAWKQRPVGMFSSDDVQKDAKNSPFNMLPQSCRLRQEKDIKALFAKGKSAFGLWMGVKFRKNNLSTSRFAVVVGSKVSKSAVVRNRLKRQVRGVVERHFSQLFPGFDVLILTKKEAVEKTSAELETQLLSLFKKIPLL